MLNKAFIAVFLLLIGGFIIYTDRKPVKKTVAISPTITPTPRIFSENKLFMLIQQWKQKEDGYTYSIENNLCKFAEERVNEIQNVNNHKAFYNWKDKQYLSQYNTIAENLANDWIEEDKLLDAWLNSPGHAKNLKDDYTYTCLRCMKNKCVQLFGNN